MVTVNQCPPQHVFSLCLLLASAIAGCHSSQAPKLSVEARAPSTSKLVTVPIPTPNSPRPNQSSDEQGTTQPSDPLVKPERPLVLFDSYHAHNFIHRGLVDGEYVYHRFTGFRRAAELIRNRGCSVDELLIGPITKQRLENVQLLVINLPSMDRPPFLVDEVIAIDEFVRGGGGILFITDHSNCYYHQYHLLPLWERLKLIPSFETLCEPDPKRAVSKIGPGWTIINDFDQHPVTQDLSAIAIQTGGRVVGDGIVARSSNQAWADLGRVHLYGEGSPGLTGDMIYSDNEPKGAFGVVLARPHGLGRIVVVSDQNIFGDAYISYADNWKLWINAVRWSGRIDLATNSQNEMDAPEKSRPASDGTLSTNQGGKASAGSLSWIDSLESNETERKQQQQLEEAELRSQQLWNVHCWEPIDESRFRWGGLDNQQYYYFFAWMNRFRWVSADQKWQYPREHAARLPMLWITRDDLSDKSLLSEKHVLDHGGKLFVILSHADPSLPAGIDVLQTTATQLEDSSPATQSALVHSQLDSKLGEHLRRLGWSPPSSEENKHESTENPIIAWQQIPILHANLSVGNGHVILIGTPTVLTNAKFLAPEVAPDGKTMRWEKQLRNWIFQAAAVTN